MTCQAGAALFHIDGDQREGAAQFLVGDVITPGHIANVAQYYRRLRCIRRQVSYLVSGSMLRSRRGGLAQQ